MPRQRPPTPIFPELAVPPPDPVDPARSCSAASWGQGKPPVEMLPPIDVEPQADEAPRLVPRSRCVGSPAWPPGELSGEEAEGEHDRTRSGTTEDPVLVREHVLREQLAVIKGRAQLLQRRIARSPRPDPGQAGGLRQIDEAVDCLVAWLDRGVPAPDADPSIEERPRAR